MNILDLIALIIFLACVFTCFRRGLLLSVFQFGSFLASLVLTYLLYPVVGGILRKTPLLGFFEGIVAETLGMDSGAVLEGSAEISGTLASFEIPDFLKTAIAGNDNPEIYQLFDVSTTSDYIASFCASLMLNALALIIVFVLVSALFAVIEKILSVASKIPVVYQFDKLGGLVVGALQGIVFVWLSFTVFSVFLSLMPDIGAGFSGLVNGSVTARIISGDGNFLLQSLLKSIV